MPTARPSVAWRTSVAAMSPMLGDSSCTHKLLGSDPGAMFAGIALRRGSWNGPPVVIVKRRVRALLAVLAAHAHTMLTRDMAIDILGRGRRRFCGQQPQPDGVPAEAILEPAYRQGESPDYVTSSAEQVALSPELIHTDLEEIRRLPGRLAMATWTSVKTQQQERSPSFAASSWLTCATNRGHQGCS